MFPKLVPDTFFSGAASFFGTSGCFGANENADDVVDGGVIGGSAAALDAVAAARFSFSASAFSASWTFVVGVC